MERPNNPLQEVRDVTAFAHGLSPGLLIFRGLLSIAFGLFAFLLPLPGLLAIAFLFGAYAFLDGVFALASGFRRVRHHRAYGFLLFEGLLGIIVGVLTVTKPAITLYALGLFIGFWAVATGIIEILASIRIPAFTPESTGTGRVLLALAGVLSISLGIGIFISPPIGPLVLLTMVAIYALVFGVVMISLGVRVRSSRATGESSDFSKAA